MDTFFRLARTGVRSSVHAVFGTPLIDEAGAGFCVNLAPASFQCTRPYMWGTERMARAVTQRGASFMAPMATL